MKTGNMEKELIRLENIWKIYNEGRPHEVRAVSDISLKIEKGSFTVFSGPSGSGKTTLISIAGTIDRPSRGRLFYDGTEITDFSDIALSRLRRKRVGFVFQDFNLIQRLSAWENVSIPLIPQGISENERKQRALQLLNTLNLSERVYHTPEQLSGGEQQRVAIARALVNNPEIIILDEPTSNIDSDTAFLLINILKGLKQEGKTILASSHEKDFINSADTVVQLVRGSLIAAQEVG